MPAPWIAGVCSGLSVHLGISVVWVRIAMLLLGCAAGAGVILYVWLWVLVRPERAVRTVGAAPAQTRAARSFFSPTVGRLALAGMGFLIVGGAVLYLWGWNPSDLRVLIPVLAIVAGLIMVWTQVPSLSDWRSPRVLALIGSGTALVAVGAVFLVARNDPADVLARGALVGIAVLAGIAVALAPIWIGLLGDLSSAKANEARETERADIAAHLHDSVLQTLTLIRASADDPSRVRSLSLTQERQLRSWLYTGSGDAGTSTAELLREQVGGIESTYGIEVEVVCVGDLPPGPSEQAAVAAASEAVTNAMKHGAPPVSVFMEAIPGGLDVFVKDAGDGFDPALIPSDRHGVNHSIIGRVKRVGGTVSIRTTDTGFRGSEIRIHVPTSESEEQ